MATEVHGYIKTFLVIATVIFIGGGYAMKVNDNTKRIIKTEDVNDSQVVQIHALELADKDIKNLAEKTHEILGNLNISINEIKRTQAQQNLLLDRNTIKLETLTKD